MFSPQVIGSTIPNIFVATDNINMWRNSTNLLKRVILTSIINNNSLFKLIEVMR